MPNPCPFQGTPVQTPDGPMWPCRLISLAVGGTQVMFYQCAGCPGSFAKDPNDPTKNGYAAQMALDVLSDKIRDGALTLAQAQAMAEAAGIPGDL